MHSVDDTTRVIKIKHILGMGEFAPQVLYHLNKCYNHKDNQFFTTVDKIKDLLVSVNMKNGNKEMVAPATLMMEIKQHIPGYISRIQLAVALAELGYLVKYTDQDAFRTNYRCQPAKACLYNRRVGGNLPYSIHI